MDRKNSTNYPNLLTDKILKFANEKDENLFDYQKIISHYMLEGDVKGLLLFWEVGLGKTMLAINIAELFRKIDNKDIIVISPKSLKDNFVTTLQKYVQNKNKKYNDLKTNSNDVIETNDIYNTDITNGIDDIDDTDDTDDTDSIDVNSDVESDINSEVDVKGEDDTENDKVGNGYNNNNDRYESYDRVSKKYSFITYGSPNMIKEMLKSSIKEVSIKDEYSSSNKVLSNKFIIVDEAHNLFNSITNGANIATQFYELVMRSKNIKLLFLTGTPIINNFFEIVPALNMCRGYLQDKTMDPLLNSKRFKGAVHTVLPESYNDFVDMFVDTETNKVKNVDKFKNRVYGLISYYGQFYFSEHIPFQKQIQESVVKDNFPVLLPIKFVKVNMDHSQNVAFLTARAKEKEEVVRAKMLFKKFGKGIYLDENRSANGGAIDKNKSIGSSSYRIKSRQISNIYIPDHRDLKKIKDDTNNDSENTDETVVMERLEEGMVIKNGKIDVSKYIPVNLSISPKFQAIINNIRKHSGQLGIVYSNFLRFGLLAFSKFLNESEYKDKYALFTGDVDIDVRNELVKKYNSPDNKHGEQIEILLISSTGEKGLNLKRVRHIHIMEPNWSYTTTEQVIGRGVRYKSHIDLPEEEQNVQVYEYLSDYELSYLQNQKPTEPTTDLDLFYKSVKNKEINDDFLKILASVSVECPKFNKYINFDCFMCESNNKILYLPNIRDDFKLDNPCRKLELKEVVVNDVTYYFDSDYHLYLKNEYGFFVRQPDDIDIVNKIKKMNI